MASAGAVRRKGDLKRRSRRSWRRASVGLGWYACACAASAAGPDPTLHGRGRLPGREGCPPPRASPAPLALRGGTGTAATRYASGCTHLTGDRVPGPARPRAAPTHLPPPPFSHFRLLPHGPLSAYANRATERRQTPTPAAKGNVCFRRLPFWCALPLQIRDRERGVSGALVSRPLRTVSETRNNVYQQLPAFVVRTSGRSRTMVDTGNLSLNRARSQKAKDLLNAGLSPVFLLSMTASVTDGSPINPRVSTETRASVTDHVRDATQARGRTPGVPTEPA